MRNTLILSCAALFAAVPAALAGGECCEKAAAKNGWCGGCKVGFYDNVQIKAQELHKALSGTEMKADDVKCPGCQEAMKADGTCEHCHVSFVKNTAYKSPVAATVAKGELVDATKIECADCQKAAKDHGWCDACKAGMVGNYKYSDKKAYEEAVKARIVIVKANEASEKCVPCAVAMVTDGTCDHCKITYKNGKPVKGQG